MQDALIDKVETEARKERTKMSIEQLLATVAEQEPREEFAKTGQPEDTGFLSKMHSSQAYMGPYSLIMAEKFIKKEEASKADTRDERISFVKMEYFLYAVSEAHRCVVDLRQMEARNNQLQDELEFLQADVASMGTVIPGYFKTKDQAADYQRRVTLAETASRTLEQLRSQISLKENELLLIFRELQSWDFNVPDHYFEREHILELQEQEERKRRFVLPTRTFWRPVFFEKQANQDIMNPKFAKRLRDFSKTKHAEGTHEGVLVSALRPFAVKKVEEYIKLDKFVFKGEIDERNDIEKIKTSIALSQQMIVADPGVRFQPRQ